MDTLSILTPPHTFTRLLSLKRSSYPLLHHLTQTTHALGFCSPKSPPTYSSSSLRFRVTFQSPSSAFPAKSQLSDADEEEDEDEYEEEDDDEDVAADEYNDVPGDIMSDGLEQSDDEIDTSMAAAEPSTRPEEFKWQRVEKLCSEVKVFGEEMIDDEELASIYDFRIDKFQVSFNFEYTIEDFMNRMSSDLHFSLINFG